MLRLATSTRRFKFLERRLYQMLCTKLCCAALRCDGGSFFPRLCEAATRRPELSRGSRELAQHAHASAVCSAVTRSHERMRAGTLASLSLSRLCAGLLSMRCWQSTVASSGGAVGSDIPGRTYRERATLRSETGAGGYEPSGWMGGRLRRCSKGVAIHYGREGGGMREKDVVRSIRVWGRLRRLQRAERRIVAWWRTSEVGDVWGAAARANDAERTTTTGGE